MYLDRFNRAFQSELGDLMLWLLGALALLSFIYVLLCLRQKKNDLFAYRHKQYYRNAESLAKGFSFVGEHKADFFGRVTPVLFSKRSYGLCLIPPPDVASCETRDRMKQFQAVIKHHQLPLFSKTAWSHLDEPMLHIQDNLFLNDGKRLLQLEHYLSDRRLGRAYTEEILIELAKAIAALHLFKDENGKSLYHGFLLPRSLFIDFDVNRSINSIVISDLGLTYSLGAKRMQQRLKDLAKGIVPIEKLYSNQILEQLVMLAPEQKNPQRVREVGAASDFYAFGALAVMLFTQKQFVNPKQVNWTSIPKQWRPFIQSCLKDDVRKRPKDFLELEDWINDPELVLTHRDLNEKKDIEEESKEESKEDEMLDLASLVDVFDALKKKKAEEQAKSSTKLSSQEEIKLNYQLEEGLKGMKLGRWKAAQEGFFKAIKTAPRNGEANVGFAIACYELGDLEKAEYYYDQAKRFDPKAAKAFRKHIAFHV
jgi:tetratricopeptide (TPR) repeat protein